MVTETAAASATQAEAQATMIRWLLCLFRFHGAGKYRSHADGKTRCLSCGREVSP